MFEVFAKYLREWVDISDQELQVMKTAGREKTLRKWQSILHDGEVLKFNCFITSGCFRLYRFDQGGTDHTVRFAIKNWWITDQESYNLGKPSAYNIEALAASTVLIWTKESWEELMAGIPALRLFNEKLLARAYEASQRRIFSLISSSAEEKYIEFQKTYPEVFDKVPLHMVASYLGISRETLSRIRKEYTKPNSPPVK